MKKILALVLTLAMLLLALPCAVAETASLADLHVSFKPVENEDGRVVLEIDIGVENGEPEQYISMLEFRYENELIASVDYVYGQSRTFVRSVPLGMSLMGMVQDLELEVSYVDFSGTHVVRSAIVSAEAGEPQLDFTRTIDKTAVSAGESVKLTYMIKNEGSVTLYNVEVYEEMPGVGVVGTAEVLSPGDMREFTKTAAVSKDVKSQPRVSFQTPSEAGSTTLVLESMNIVVSNPQLTVTLKSDAAGVQSGESVTLVCSVVNTGNVPLSNVSITDAVLGTIIESAQIETGKAYSWNKVIKPVSSQNYMFTVNALDASGQIYTTASNIVTVEVASPTPSEGVETLEVTVTPNTKSLEQPGEITFNFLLRNTGSMDATGVSIADRDGNVLERLNSLAPGDKMIPVVMSVTESGEYYFTVDATLAGGTRVQRTTVPITIDVGVVRKSQEPLTTTVIETPVPVETPQIMINNDRMGGIAPWILMVIIFIALLIVACVMVLVILQVRAARRRDEEEAEDVYIPPQNPVRRPMPPANENDPYDYRDEISRVATEYSRPVQTPPRPERRIERMDVAQDDEDVQTVYKPRKKEEPRTKRN